MNSPFDGVELAPRDPIIGLTEAFAADSRSTKVNLGVGVYCDDNGRIPLLRAVREAERARVEAGAETLLNRFETIIRPTTEILTMLEKETRSFVAVIHVTC